MPFRPLFRSLVLPFAAGLLVLGLACKGKHHGATSASTPTDQVLLKGTVTFDRIPVVRDTNGLPTGLETDPTKFQTNLPARHVHVVLYEEVDVPDSSAPSGQRVFYRVPSGGDTLTAKDGTYSYLVTKGVNYMVEIQSTANVGDGATNSSIFITADPAGMSSTVPVLNRLRYCFRQNLTGAKPPTSAGQNHVAFSAIQADTTLDFHIGINDTWFLADTDRNSNTNLPIGRFVPSYSPGSPLFAFAGQAESTPSGSKIMGILDSIATFVYCEGIDGYSFPTIYGSLLNLNYVPGFAEPKGSYVEFNRASYPLVPGPAQQSVAFDPLTGTLHYLGALSGSPDVAWDEGAILTLLARTSLFSQFLSSGLYAGDDLGAVALPPAPISSALPDLHPNLALVEGLSELMAALIQKNPYVGLAGKDIRDLSGISPSDKTIYSAPFLRALGWQAALLEHNITSPGTVSTWANIKINNMRPFLILSAPTSSADTQNLYLQLNTLSTAGTTAAGATPSSIFTTTAIQNLLASSPLSVPAGNIPWPRPSSGPLAALNLEWGTNPTGALPDTTLSMANAIQVNGAYPNLTHGELTFAHFTQTGVKQYKLGVALLNGGAPTTLSGGEVEVTFISPNTPSGNLVQSFLFSTSTATPLDLLIEGTANSNTSHFVRIRMLSPNTLQPDTTVQVTLTPQN